MALFVVFPASHPPPQECTLDRPRSSVSFSLFSELSIVENLTVNHKDDLWYTKDELDAFKIKNRKLPDNFRLQENMTIDDYERSEASESFSFMGLESILSRELAHEVYRNRQVYFTRFFLEQARQIHFGVQDPDRLSMVATQNLEWARKRAYLIGVHHATSET